MLDALVPSIRGDRAGLGRKDALLLQPGSKQYRNLTLSVEIEAKWLQFGNGFEEGGKREREEGEGREENEEGKEEEEEASELAKCSGASNEGNSKDEGREGEVMIGQSDIKRFTHTNERRECVFPKTCAREWCLLREHADISTVNGLWGDEQMQNELEKLKSSFDNVPPMLFRSVWE